MPTTESLAAVVTDKRQIEMRGFPVPQVSPADAILKVELRGICGVGQGRPGVEIDRSGNPRRRGDPRSAESVERVAIGAAAAEEPEKIAHGFSQRGSRAIVVHRRPEIVIANQPP
jgi:hypothetical protein